MALISALGQLIGPIGIAGLMQGSRHGIHHHLVATGACMRQGSQDAWSGLKASSAQFFSTASKSSSDSSSSESDSNSDSDSSTSSSDEDAPLNAAAASASKGRAGARTTSRNVAPDVHASSTLHTSSTSSSPSQSGAHDRPFITKPARKSRSGYPETVDALRDAHDSIHGRSGNVASMHGLKVPVSDGNGDQLTADEARVLENLVGCLTKEGKKATAQRIVLDAMAIIRRELEKSAAEAKAAEAEAAAKAAAAAAAAASKAAKGGRPLWKAPAGAGASAPVASGAAAQ